MNKTLYSLRRQAVFLLAVLLICLNLPLIVWAENKEVSDNRRLVTVGYSEIPGMSEKDEDGGYKGLIIDYLYEIAKYTNWDYRFVESKDLVTDFMNGSFDLIGGNYYYPGYEEYFSYPKYSMGNSRSALFCREGDQTIKNYEIRSLNGKTIGVFAPAEEKIRRLKDFLQINGLECELKYYNAEDQDENQTLLPYLLNGDVDLLLSNETDRLKNTRMAFTFAGQPYYIVAHVGCDELTDEIDMALEKIMDSDPQFPEEHYNANFPYRISLTGLNQEERDYIQEKKVVTVAVVGKNHPFYCIDNAIDHHDGILPDLMNHISEFSGLSFSYLCADSYLEAAYMVRQNKADILGYYLDDDETAIAEGLVLSKPYLSLNNIPIKNKKAVYPEAGQRVGILEGRNLPDDIEYGEIYRYPTVHEGVKAVEEHEIDVYFGLASTMEQELQAHRYLNVVPVSRVNYNSNAAFALNRPADTRLLTILNKAIANISLEEMNTILDRNLVSMGYGELTLTDWIYANPIAFAFVTGIFLLLAFGALFLIERARVRELLIQKELEKSESRNAAKSEFLSRMSHEIRTPMNAIVGMANLVCMEKDLPIQVRTNLKKILASAQYLVSLINDILDMSRIESGKLVMEEENFSLADTVEEIKDMMKNQAKERQVTFDVDLRIRHAWLVSDPVRLRQVLINLVSNAIKFTPPGGSVILRIEELETTENQTVFHFSVKDTGVGIPKEDQKRIFESFEQLGNNSSKSAGTGLGLPISDNIVKALGGCLEVESALGEGSEFYFTLTLLLGTEEEGDKKEKEEAWADPEDLHGVSVLLVEDNELNAEIAKELLEMEGAKVEWAADGEEAFQLFASSEPDRYQVVLMDIRMPKMDGLEAARAIRGCGHPNASGIPIIAMTANSFKEDLDAAYGAGMNGFVPKPIDLAQLNREIRKHLT